jgi:AbrB family looped-hinge helix DNA binding protein
MRIPEVKVTRKYQITIPKEIRRHLKINIGEKLPIKRKGAKIIIEVKNPIERPSDYLWNISKKQTRINVVNLIKTSRRKMS